MTSTLTTIFSDFQTYLSTEQNLREEIRDAVKDIEQTAREILTILQSIHQEEGFKTIPESCSKVRQHFKEIESGFSKLATLIPQDQYYRFNDHWRFVIQRLSFLASLLIYLESEKLASKPDVASLLGVKINRSEGFHLDVEDYLMGLLQLCTELVRFAVNCVVNRDFQRPLNISNFIAEVNAGFRLLNLKNDTLRKRFDVLKYDVKRIEEIVYDLSIRGLKNGESEKPAEEPQKPSEEPQKPSEESETKS